MNNKSVRLKQSKSNESWTLSKSTAIEFSTGHGTKYLVRPSGAIIQARVKKKDILIYFSYYVQNWLNDYFKRYDFKKYDLIDDGIWLENEILLRNTITRKALNLCDNVNYITMYSKEKILKRKDNLFRLILDRYDPNHTDELEQVLHIDPRHLDLECDKSGNLRTNSIFLNRPQ